MANLLLCDFSISDGATVLDKSSQVAAFPTDNLFTSLPSDVWRASDLTAQYIELDLGAAKEINTIAMLYTTAELGVDWRVRSANSQANLTAAPEYDLGTGVDHWPTGTESTWDRTHAFLYLSSSQTSRYWRIDIAAQSTTQYQAGRILLGLAPSTTKTVGFGYTLQMQDEAEILRLESGGSYALSGGRYRQARFSYVYLTEAEAYDDLLWLDRKVGTSSDIICVRDPADNNRIMDELLYGRLQPGAANLQIKTSNSAFIFTKNYSVIESELP